MITQDALFPLLADLHRAQIVLRIEEGQLRFRAPRGAMTTALAEAVKASRQALVDYLAVGTGWPIALSAAESAIDQAEQDQRLTNVQRRVLGHYRTVARKHHDNHDAALFNWADAVRYQMQSIWGLSPSTTDPLPVEFRP